MTFLTTQIFWERSSSLRNTKTNELFVSLEKNISIFDETFVKIAFQRLITLFFELGKNENKVLFINNQNNPSFFRYIVIRSLQSYSLHKNISNFLLNINKSGCDVVVLTTISNFNYIINESLSKRIVVVNLCDDYLEQHKVNYSFFAPYEHYKIIYLSYFTSVNFFLLGQLFSFCKSGR